MEVVIRTAILLLLDTPFCREKCLIPGQSPCQEYGAFHGVANALGKFCSGIYLRDRHVEAVLCVLRLIS